MKQDKKSVSTFNFSSSARPMEIYAFGSLRARKLAAKLADWRLMRYFGRLSRVESYLSSCLTGFFSLSLSLSRAL